jgi:hypothetical protein
LQTHDNRRSDYGVYGRRRLSGVLIPDRLPGVREILHNGWQIPIVQVLIILLWGNRAVIGGPSGGV